MQIFRSRFTPGVKADEIKLKLEEKVKIQFSDGTECEAIVRSELMSHDATPNMGYEFESIEDKSMFFTDAKNVIWWEGKVESENRENVTFKP